MQRHEAGPASVTPATEPPPPAAAGPGPVPAAADTVGGSGSGAVPSAAGASQIQQEILELDAEIAELRGRLVQSTVAQTHRMLAQVILGEDA